MIKTFKYYQGCSVKELFRYIIYYPFRIWFFGCLYSIWIPTGVSIKTPLSYRFKIFDYNGNELTKIHPTIIRYNSKTKKAIIRKIESLKPIKLAKNEYGEDTFESLYLPDSYLKFV